MSRLLLIGQSYGRGHAATSTLFTDLAEGLARHGHAVEVLTSAAEEQGASSCWEAGVRVHRVSGRLRLGLPLLWLRLIRWCLCTPRHFDQAVLLDTPYLLTLGDWILRARHGTRLIAWVMDRPLLQISRLNPPGSVKAWLGALLDRIQCRLYAACHHVVALGSCMAGSLAAGGVPSGRLRVIRSWDDDGLVDQVITPAAARARCGLPEAFTVMYSGYAGAWHDFAPILEAVRALAPSGEIQFLFRGLGPGIETIRHWARENPEASVLFGPLVEPSTRIRSLCCGDLHLVALRESMLGTCCPSKLNPLLALGRPVIAIAPPSCQTCIDLTISGAGLGATTGPELVDAIRHLRAAPAFPEPFASRGRAAYRIRHSATPSLQAWDRLIREDAPPCPPSPP